MVKWKHGTKNVILHCECTNTNNIINNINVKLLHIIILLHWWYLLPLSNCPRFQLTIQQVTVHWDNCLYPCQLIKTALPLITNKCDLILWLHHLRVTHSKHTHKTCWGKIQNCPPATNTNTHNTRNPHLYTFYLQPHQFTKLGWSIVWSND